MKIAKPGFFWVGICAAVFLILSYFVTFNVDSSANYVVQDRLLGIVVFHNAFILCVYVVIAAILIAAGVKFNNHKMKGGKRK
jgi:hypothetical protein